MTLPAEAGKTVSPAMAAAGYFLMSVGQTLSRRQ